MANINEVYGSSYKTQAIEDKALYAAKLYATNIAHKQFSFRNEATDMWTGNNMKQNAIDYIVNQVPQINPKLKVVHINKTSGDINMFPYLINGPVEYFAVIDLEHVDTSGKVQVYSVYITNLKMEAY